MSLLRPVRRAHPQPRDRGELQEKLRQIARDAARESAFDRLGRRNPRWGSMHRQIDDLLDEWERP